MASSLKSQSSNLTSMKILYPTATLFKLNHALGFEICTILKIDSPCVRGFSKDIEGEIQKCLELKKNLIALKPSSFSH